MQTLSEFKPAMERVATAFAKQSPHSFKSALLATLILVLQSDGPLNTYEVLFLDEMFGRTINVEELEVRLKLDPNLSGQAVARLIEAAMILPSEYDVIGVISRAFDLSLSADKLPSESEAWAAARVISKLRRASATTAGWIHPELPDPAVGAAASEPELVLETRAPSKRPKVRKTSVTGQTADVNAILAELHQLVGLDTVKVQIETLVNLAKVRAMRERRGLPSPPMSYHLVFAGNPGTGKTTVARLIGRIYGALGLISKGSCIEIDRSHLIGKYLGETTQKTAEVLTSALGSVLFIDEAYSLTQGDQDQYGAEALAVILKFMEDHREDFVLIVAGYTDLMDQFLNSNPGLRSRFSRTIEFPDYGEEDMRQILNLMCADSHYMIDPLAEQDAAAQIRAILGDKDANFANAREVRRLFEQAVARQANRIANASNCSDAELCTLTSADFAKDETARRTV